MAFLLKNSWVLRKNVCLCGWQPFFLTNFLELSEAAFYGRGMIPAGTVIVGKLRDRRITTGWEHWLRLPAEWRCIIGRCLKPALLPSALIPSISTVPTNCLLPLPLCICFNSLLWKVLADQSPVFREEVSNCFTFPQLVGPAFVQIIIVLLGGGVGYFSYCSLLHRYFLLFYLTLFPVLLYKVNVMSRSWWRPADAWYSVLIRSLEFSKRVDGLTLVILLS